MFWRSFTGCRDVGCVFTRTVWATEAVREITHPTPEVFAFFVQKTGGKGHQTRMQAVLKAYVEARKG